MPKKADHTLIPEQLAEIRRAMKSRDAKVAKRASMLYNPHQGYRPDQVSEIHAVSTGTVYNTFNRYQTEGLSGLANLGFTVWTLPSLAAFMIRETGVDLGLRNTVLCVSAACSRSECEAS